MNREELKARVTRIIASTRFPFVDQTDWSEDYQTITNDNASRRGIQGPDGKVFPSIVVSDSKGDVKEIGEVEMEDTCNESQVQKWRLLSEKAGMGLKTKRFFLFVPKGRERASLKLLEDNNVEYAGLSTWDIRHGNLTVNPYRTPDAPVKLDHVNLIKKTYIRTEIGMKIYLVDAEYLRNYLEIDFTVGGHYWVYPFIPRDEIWLDEAYTQVPKELEYFIAHELEEIRHMRRGMRYEDAHALANKLERQIRERVDQEMNAPPPIDKPDESTSATK